VLCVVHRWLLVIRTMICGRLGAGLRFESGWRRSVGLGWGEGRGARGLGWARVETLRAGAGAVCVAFGAHPAFRVLPPL